MRAVVFLGPSASLEQARRVLDAEYRSPVKRGDIEALLTCPPEAIGIVDGLFFQNFAVSPKEVLAALRSGVRVYGASSMGALRAVELAAYGMIGVGQVFERYRSGLLEADDEVAMVYSPDDFRALSEPLVNIDHALSLASARGILTRVEARKIVARTRRLFYAERSYARVLEIASPILAPARAAALRDYLRESPPDLKRADALEMLSRMAVDLLQVPRAEAPTLREAPCEAS